MEIMNHLPLILALAGLTTALVPRQLRQLESGDASPHDLIARTVDPCKVLSEAYKQGNYKPGNVSRLAIPPSIGIACLKSVPLAKELDIALLDYLEPFINFQSTLEILAGPPEDYLFPGVDVLGGLDIIRQNLKDNKYKTQYDVMTDVRSLFVAANDGHFSYSPALLSAFTYARTDLEFQSVSLDGIQLPQIFHNSDVALGIAGKLDFYPSAVESIDEIPVFEWLENDATLHTGNFQDPDAQFNRLFSTLPSFVNGRSATTISSSFEVPDSYTVKYFNGSTIKVVNGITISPATDFRNIESGEDFQKTLEIPPKTVASKFDDSKNSKSSIRRDTRHGNSDKNLPGFPVPDVKDPTNTVSGYFLKGENMEKTAVLSILGFLPPQMDPNDLAKFNAEAFVLECQNAVIKFIAEAQKAGRTKLVIDLSANSGGIGNLAEIIYLLLFPDGKLSILGRYRANEALGLASEADYDALVKVLISQSPALPIGVDGKGIKTGSQWFGPEVIKGENVTVAFQRDSSVPWDLKNHYLNGFDPSGRRLVHKAPWKPEDILLVTDGTCSSACNLLAGLLIRNHGIRSLALGGRPLQAAMQAMGGVKGTLLNFGSDLINMTASFFKSAEVDGVTLKSGEDVFPSLAAPPLLPLNVASNGIRVNSRSGYTADDLNGYPVQFRYEAANCRIFYTQRMLADPSETWRRASNIAWLGAPCVPGSTSTNDGTIGNTTVKFDLKVKSNARHIQVPHLRKTGSS